MKKVLSIIAIFLLLLMPLQQAYSDWASPNVINTAKTFVYNGIRYTVSITDTVTSSKATTLLSAVASSNFSKVAIPLRFLGWVGAAASIGYLVYDLTSAKQSLINYYPLPRPLEYMIFSNPADGSVGTLQCGSCQYVINEGNPYQTAAPHWVYIPIQLNNSAPCGANFVLGKGEIRQSNWGSTVTLYTSFGYQSEYFSYYCQDNTRPQPVGNVDIDTPPFPSEQQIRDFVESHPDVFQNMSPVLSPNLPSDAVEISDYPSPTATLDSEPEQQPQESQPNPQEQSMPQPENPDNYINPDVPAVPSFDTAFDIPEKKNIKPLIDSWLSVVPFLGMLKQIGISGSGSCSFTVATPFNRSGVLNFCQYESVFEVIGGFVFAFASVYAVYIIFKRSD